MSHEPYAMRPTDGGPGLYLENPLTVSFTQPVRIQSRDSQNIITRAATVHASTQLLPIPPNFQRVLAIPSRQNPRT